MALFHSPRIVMDKLVYHIDVANVRCWPGSGTTLSNLAPYAYDGTLSNGAAVTSGNLVLDGTNDNVAYAESNISKDPSLFLGSVTGQLTYECWVQRVGTSVDVTPRIMSTDASDYTAIYLNGSGATTLTFSTNANNATNSTSSTDATAVPTSEWTHIACTYDGQLDGTNKYIYLNGVEDKAVDAGVEAASYGDGTTRVFALGSNVESTVQNNNCFNGYINVARIYGKALSAAEVLQNYNAQKVRFGR